jgi:hypothetical protein
MQFQEVDMSELAYPHETLAGTTRPNWPAIWAGVFTFIGIWAVFGTLGMGIFAGAASASAAEAMTGVGIGMAIWTIVLTVIAMFVAGRTIGQLAGVTASHDGIMNGTVMFGLTVAAGLVLYVLGGSLAGAVAGTMHGPYLLRMFSGAGWTGFIALFLGWLAAMGGASSGGHSKAEPQTVVPVQQQQVRHA